MTTSISIALNGEAHTVSAGTTLADLLAQVRPDLDQERAALATAINGRHIARNMRAQQVLQANDQVTTFEPISGG